MKARRISSAHFGLFIFAAIWFFILVPLSALAAPYAAFVMDARTGEVLHSRNADTRLHPASLTKMMTLYIAFEAIRKGEISTDTIVTISRNAASEPPSKLGLKSGQRIAFRYLIRAAAVKSANDAATAIGEAIEGSEAKFARRMNRTAKALGMTRTTFKNAHGLTEAGHLSTARDMTNLGRHLFFDFPQYYNLFSRTSTDAGVRQVNNTNRRLLAAYQGADGIKTGYTRAAGFNLVSSAKRGNERVIATVFGGTSTAQRNGKIAELLDMGFRRSPSSAPIRKPAAPVYAESSGGKGKTIRLSGTVEQSKRPQIRPVAEVEVLLAAVDPAPLITEALSEGIAAALEEAQSTPALAPKQDGPQEKILLASASIRPALRPKGLVRLLTQPRQPKAAQEQETVTRMSTSGGRHWGINIGRYPSRFKAESVLITTALAEMSTLQGSLRKVVRRPQGFDANFLGMTRETADLACRRLAARNVSCLMVGPS